MNVTSPSTQSLALSAGRMRALRPDLLAYTAPFQAAYDDTSRKNGILPLFLRLLAEVFPG